MPTEERQTPGSGAAVIRWATIILFVVMIGGYFWTLGERNAADNNVRTGMSSSQPNPLPSTAPSRDKSGG